MILLPTLQRQTTFTMNIHFRCRGGVYPTSDIQRFVIKDDVVPWNVTVDTYDPPSFNSPKILNQPWADPEIGVQGFNPKWNELDGNIDRHSHTGQYQIVNGSPRNPVGRTGIKGRGVLGRWGPNHAADPIVTRWKTESGGEKVLHTQSRNPILQFVAIQRNDTKEWAIPGGMVDPGEVVTKTLQREFGEEALNSEDMSQEEKKQMQTNLGIFFNAGIEVYKGYVDDPRNTDNAWMETVAMNFHDEKANFVGHMKLHAGDDAINVQWMDMGEDIALYANHCMMLSLVAKLRKAHWESACVKPSI